MKAAGDWVSVLVALPERDMNVLLWRGHPADYACTGYHMNDPRDVKPGRGANFWGDCGPDGTDYVLDVTHWAPIVGYPEMER